MAIKALVTIEGYELPEPASYSANTVTVVDSDTNAEGKYFGAVIRDNVGTVDLSWNYLTIGQWATINKLFKTSDGGSYVNTVAFFDQSSGDFVTREMYVSDRSAGMWRRDSETGNILGWTNCKLTLSEV